MGEPFFIDVDDRRLFAIAFAPATAARGTVLFCPPFAEEMNKGRRMVSQTARRLASQGFLVLSLDLFGTGDSSGDFQDASWEAWRTDLQAGVNWLRTQAPGHDPVFWALRLGACLAIDVATASPSPPSRMVLWQPVVSGKTFVTQFLRLRVAAEKMQRGSTTSTSELRDRSAAGETLEVAGYALNPGLIESIEAMDLRACGLPGECAVDWFDLAASPTMPRSPLVAATTNHWIEQHSRVAVHEVVSEPFWSTVEISECPELIEQTANVLANHHA